MAGVKAEVVECLPGKHYALSSNPFIAQKKKMSVHNTSKHTLTHTLTHSHTLTHKHTQSHTHSLTQSLTYTHCCSVLHVSARNHKHISALEICLLLHHGAAKYLRSIL
jgi:hypothetical protein